jgi:nucleotide-binding universal stress UspA family protein
MIHIENILVPVDFSDPSKKAVKYGLSLAAEFNARLIIAHIVPDYRGLDYTFPTEAYDLEKLAYQDARTRMSELLPANYRDKTIVETLIKGGDVKDEILGLVQEKNIDLVVMGSHGRRNFERLFLGSVTERMLRQLPVPVLTVSQQDADPAALKRIVYATDLSEGFEAGLQFSIRLARGLDAALTVTHVIAMQQAYVGAEMAAYLPNLTTEVRKQTEEMLSRSIALNSDGSVPITTVIGDGVPFKSINELAARVNADLIVINLHGKSRLERALLGSTAERLIRTATIPVLSLPFPAVYASRWAAA